MTPKEQPQSPKVTVEPGKGPRGSELVTVEQPRIEDATNPVADPEYVRTMKAPEPSSSLQSAAEEYVHRCPMCNSGIECQDDLCYQFRHALAGQQEPSEEIRRLGVHLSHCNFGEQPGACKYGEDDCPALTEAWSWFGHYLQRADQRIARAGQQEQPRESLRYCGACNQRRYFRDGKCEVCESLALRATAKQVVAELEARGTVTNDSLNKLRAALAAAPAAELHAPLSGAKDDC